MNLKQLLELARERNPVGKKGAFSIIGLVMTFVSLVVYVALLPVILELIEDATANAGLDTATELVISLFPFLILIMIVVGMVYYAMPQRQVGY